MQETNRTRDRLLSLASGTLPEFDPPTVVESAARGGFGSAGVWFDAESFTPAVLRATAAAFSATGIAPLEIEVLVVGDPAMSEADARQLHARLLDAGAELGCTEAIVVSREADADRNVDLLAALNELAQDRGVHLCLEFLPIFAIRDLPAAVAVVEAVGDGNLKILVDPLHVARSGTDLQALAALPDRLFSFAQFCDAPAAAPGDGGFDALYDEALNGRLLPGEGGLPLAALLEVLPDTLPLSLELRSGALRSRYPDPRDRAAVVYRATRSWLDAL